MSIIFSHPTGNANSRAAAKSFANDNLLYEFHTTIASFSGSMLDRLGAFPSLSEIRRRRFDSELRSFVRMSPWVELGRILASKVGMHSLISHEHGMFCIDKVYRNIDKKVSSRLWNAANKGIEAVYAYEDEAVISFREAKKHNVKCLYDLPTGYWRAARSLMEDQREAFPEWESTLIGFKDSMQKLEQKDEEIRLADLIFVASSFTAKTLKHYPGKTPEVQVIPYGFPPVSGSRHYPANTDKKKLKLLFVGRLSQQKGLANLFAAVKPLKGHVELTLVGTKGSNKCSALEEELTRHQWIPTLHHQGVLDLMCQHDVLLFPSLFDGFGLVITEAMSQGTPVIASERCAGPDIIKHGENGWLIEAGSTESLQAAIENMLENRANIAETGKRALEAARLRPWAQYGVELTAAIRTILKPI